MVKDTINNVWVEGQIDADGICLTLLTERRGAGARVEEVKYFTFEELQSAEGDLFSMNMSAVSKESLSEMGRLSDIGHIVDNTQSPLPEVGDCLTDQNPPSWASDSDYLEVVEVLPDTRCDEYVIEENRYSPDQTVADANPSYDADEPVVIAQYNGTGDHYAFPVSRLA